MICPNISWFHTVVTILAIRYRISRQTSHPLHLPHAASWIFDKIIPRLQLFNKFQHMPIHSVTEFCILTDWFQTPCSRILSSVMTDCRNAERGQSGLAHITSGVPKRLLMSSAVTLLISSYKLMFSKSLDHSTLNTS